MARASNTRLEASALGQKNGHFGSSPMSALGHKRTFALQNVMSALPPIATAKALPRERACPLYTRKQTCAVQL
jgi:hypothetical protein